MHFRFTTAGESHGPALVAIVEGLPAGLPVTAAFVDAQLARRMQGYGRGARMQIEQDRIEWLGGVRSGETLGSPVAMRIANRDWANWKDVMDPEGTPGEHRRRQVTRPRPGHADLVGVLKYDRDDARDILERASARETAARVAAGALARRLLEEFGVGIGSHVVSLGGIRAERPAALPSPLNDAADRSPLRVLDPGAEQAMTPPDRRGEGGRGHAGRGSGGRRRGAGPRARQPRQLGPEARRPARRAPDVDSRGEGGRDRARLRGGAPARLRGARPDPPRAGARRQRARRATTGRRTTPAASRGA